MHDLPEASTSSGTDLLLARLLAQSRRAALVYTIAGSAYALVMAAAWIRRRYQAKYISDESVTVDAIWIFFAIVHSMGLVFEYPLWALTSLAAFGSYKTCVRAGFSWLGRQREPSQKSPVLLVLRIVLDPEGMVNVCSMSSTASGDVSEASR